MATKKRRRKSTGNGTGTMHERPDGKYQVQITVGRTPTGGYKRLSKTFVRKSDAKAWLAKQLTAQAEGTLATPSRMTLNQLAEHWVESNPTWAAGTKASNIDPLKLHVLPELGHKPVVDIKPAHVQSLINKLREKNSASLKKGLKDQPLSETAIRRVIARLSSCLNHGMRLEIVHRNVTKNVRLPRPQSVKHAPWTLAEAQAVMRACRELNTTISNYVFVGVNTGMRKQELRGLRWKHVDLKRAEIHVREVVVDEPGGMVTKERTKSDAGYRTVHVDAGTVAVLRAQEQHRHASSDLVFPGPAGRPLQSHALREGLDEIQSKANVKRIRLYDTRSSHGTLLAEAGVNPKIISERLGHANVAFTMQVYVRPAREEHRAVAEVMGDLVRGDSAVVAAVVAPDLPETKVTEGDTVSASGTTRATEGD